MGDYWQYPELEQMHKAMLLLGWRADNRLTSEDEAIITDDLNEALALHSRGKLTPNEIDRLSARAHQVIAFQIMGVDARAAAVRINYEFSEHLKPHLSLIDEATCCYYRGYYTAALAVLFVVLESYLRSLYGWKPGDVNPSFSELKSAVSQLDPGPFRSEAAAILDVVYRHYQPTNPPQFLFNRHGLLHGLRGISRANDKMNCARLFLLLDVLCSAEGVAQGGYEIHGEDDPLLRRLRLYQSCLT